MIYDCFIFFNELDLLEIRLNTLNEIVDQFVLVEATLTHQGKKKPLHFYENRARFKFFQHKITHVVIDDYPTFFFKWKKPTSWDLERHQRNGINQVLKKCKPDDVILVSDLDEIPNPQKVLEYKGQAGLKVFQHKNYYYYLNCVSKESSERWWLGTVMAFYKDFSKSQDLRSVSNKLRGDKMKLLNDKWYRFFKSIINPIYGKPVSIVADAGWHFSYLGGVDKIIEKLEAFAHQEFNQESFKDKESILNAITSGRDIFNRNLEYEFVSVDSTYPQFILQNLNRHAHLIKAIESK
jgi:beta-1,4-mannosyl-glycoprotein beta-1,4-N-acetylglucosaminyltransferase